MHIMPKNYLLRSNAPIRKIHDFLDLNALYRNFKFPSPKVRGSDS